MDLVDHRVIGFSGKRQLDNPEDVRRVLRDLLKELHALAGSQLVGMSSVAIGADLLFVEEVTTAGMPWICVLPFPAEAFFNETDFPNAEERKAAENRAHQTIACEVMRVPQNPTELRDPTWRRVAFAEAGFKCVDEADLLVAVLHEDAEGGKAGGTAEVVAHARAVGRPLAVIDPDTLEVRRENWPNEFLDPLTKQLRRLPDGVLTENDREVLPVITPAALKVAGWRSGFARAARRHVPGIRWGTTAVVVLHALATILTAAVFLLLERAIAKSFIAESYVKDETVLVYWLDVIAFIFVLAGFLFLNWLLWKHPQVNAANYRLAAEVGRSILATWSLPEAGAQIIRILPPQFAHFARNLILAQRFDRNRPTPDQPSPVEVEKLSQDYLQKRIRPQKTYYHGKHKRAKQVVKWLELSSLIFSFIAVLCAGVLAFKEGSEAERALWGMGKLAAATAAPVVVSLLIIHEVKRRAARYQQMETALTEYERKIARVRSLSGLQVIVTDVERMLLNECYEWWVLARENVAA